MQRSSRAVIARVRPPSHHLTSRRHLTAPHRSIAQHPSCWLHADDSPLGRASSCFLDLAKQPNGLKQATQESCGAGVQGSSADPATSAPDEEKRVERESGEVRVEVGSL